MQCLEHVANPLGWLNDVAECLTPGGRLNLTLPDARRTFDHARRLTSAADMVEAHELRLTRPSFRQVFDHIANVAPLDEQPSHSPDCLFSALSVARVAVAGEYVDVHCHVWTHDSFLECWSMIEALGICALRLDKSWPPIASANEFSLSFRKP